MCVGWDYVSSVLSLVSVAMYFNEEGVLGELEEVAADSILALRNAVQYIRLAIFLKYEPTATRMSVGARQDESKCLTVPVCCLLRNRTEKSRLHDSDIDIDFESIASHPDNEREAILNAESGIHSDSDSDSDDSDMQVVVPAQQ